MGWTEERKRLDTSPMSFPPSSPLCFVLRINIAKTSTESWAFSKVWPGRLSATKMNNNRGLVGFCAGCSVASCLHTNIYKSWVQFICVGRNSHPSIGCFDKKRHCSVSTTSCLLLLLLQPADPQHSPNEQLRPGNRTDDKIARTDQRGYR